MAQQRHQPARADHHFINHARRRLEGAAKPRIGFTRARGAHRHVERQRQHLDLCGLRAVDQIETDFVVVLREAVQLKPEHIGRDLSDLLDSRAAGDAERIGHARRLRRLRHQQIGARPDQRRPAHRRDSDWRGIARAEQFDAGRRQSRHHAIARHHLDVVEGVPVMGDADIVAGAGVAILESKARHVARRVFAQIGRGREMLEMLLETRA